MALQMYAKRHEHYGGKEMNQKERLIKRNNSARMLEHTSAIHRNCVRFNTGNSMAHELQKARAALFFINLGYEVITEAEFKGKIARADLFILDDCVAVEILHSEKEESIIKKSKKYPCRIVSIKTTDTLSESLIK